MAILSELTVAVKSRRQAMGLSQEKLARLAGLSRATINDIETGRVRNLSLTRAEELANALGLGIAIEGQGGRRAAGSPLAAAARLASVSYGAALPEGILEEALRQGIVAPGYLPHMRAILDEAPVAMLHEVAMAIEQKHGIPASTTWQNMRRIAAVLKCQRELWQ